LVEAPGIENDLRRSVSTIQQENGSIRHDAVQAHLPDRAPKCAIDGRVETESSDAYELRDVVEPALARALVLAAEAQRWEVVVQIAAELQARRQTRESVAGSRVADAAATSRPARSPTSSASRLVGRTRG
jgi:hypothetical protein